MARPCASRAISGTRNPIDSLAHRQRTDVRRARCGCRFFADTESAATLAGEVQALLRGGERSRLGHLAGEDALAEQRPQLPRREAEDRAGEPGHLQRVRSRYGDLDLAAAGPCTRLPKEEVAQRGWGNSRAGLSTGE